ncbi:MAG: fibronectin type III domain-containing protein [Pseudomonadota bacterium]
MLSLFSCRADSRYLRALSVAIINIAFCLCRAALNSGRSGLHLLRWLLFFVFFFPVYANAVVGDGYYVEYISPLSDSAFNRYSRYIDVPVVKGTVNLQAWVFDRAGGSVPCYPNRLCSTKAPTEMPTVWLTLDGVRISGALTGSYKAALDTTKYADGSHVLSAEVRSNDGSATYAVPLEIVIDNLPGAIAGKQRIPVCTTKFDIEFMAYSTQGCEWIDYSGTPTMGRPTVYKTPRTATPLTSVPKTSDLWVEKMVDSVHHGWLSRFNIMPGGHITTRSRQNYFYSDLNRHNIAEIDGPRNVGALGFAVGGQVGHDGTFYVVTTNGRFLEVELDGTVETIAGGRVKPGKLPSYWNSLDPKHGNAGVLLQDAQWETVGNFVDGPAFFNEPWDAVVDINDDEIWYITDTLNHRIVKVNEHTSPATITTFAGSTTAKAGFLDGNGKNALLNEPWNLATDKSGNLYVSDRLNHAIRKIDRAGNVTTVFRSSITPPLVVDSLYKRHAALPTGKTLLDVRNLYMINGAFGVASLAYPEGLRFDSQGRLIVAEGLTRVLRRIDLTTKRIDFIRNIPSDNDMNVHNININMDDGSCGGKDDILVATFAQVGPWRVKADGSSYAPIYDQSTTLGTFEGRANHLHTQTYPWLAVCGNGAIWLSGVSEGLFRLTLAKQSDPSINPTLYRAGEQVFYNGTVPNFPGRPGFHLRHGIAGQDQFGGETMDELGMRPDAEIKSMMQSGWGSSSGPRPEISGKDLDNLLYFIRWNCSSCIAAGKTAAPIPQMDATPPVISNVVVKQTGSGTVSVTWSTNESTNGFVNFGKNTLYNNSSNTESTFSTTHQAIISDLFPGVTYHFRVRARDVAGNQAVSGDIVLTTSGTVVSDTVLPSVPASLAATAVSTSQINLTWQPSTDNTGVIGYKVYRNGIQIAVTTMGSYQDSGLIAGTVYAYNVAAYDAAGNTSAQSAIVRATTQGTVSTVTFNFSLANGGGRSVTPGGSTSTTATASLVAGASQNVSFASSGLPQGATVSFSTASCSPTCTTTVTFQTASTLAIGAYPISITASGGGITHVTSITLTVVSSQSTTGGYSVGNRVRVTSAANVRVIPSATITTVPATKQPNLLGTQAAGAVGSVVGGPKIADGYTWWRLDYDTGVDGWTIDSFLQATTADTTAPGIPTSLIATPVSVRQVNLKWVRGSDNVTAGIVHYDLYRNGVFIASTASTNYQDGELIANTSYRYTIRSRDIAGNVSPQTSSVTALTLATTSTSPLDNIPVGTWYAAPNSKVGDIQYQWPTSMPFGTGQPRYLTESSGAYDSTRNRFIIWGGGHNDYAGNEIYTFDLNTLTWRRQNEPALNTDIKSAVESTGYYPDANGDVDVGQPRSRHTYDSIQYLPSVDRFCSFGMFAGYPASKNALHTDCFNFNNKRWEQKADIPSAGQSIVAMSAYDPITGHAFYLRGAAPLSEYDPLANKWTQRSVADAGYYYDATAIIDTKRHRFVALGINQLIWYDLNGTGTLTQQRVNNLVTGDKEILQARRPGFAYDAVNDVYVAWSGESADLNGDGVVDVTLPPENIYVINPVTWVAKKITPAATNAVKPRSPFPISNGLSNSTFGRFAYIPSKNIFILVNNWPGENVFFYKLDPAQVRSTAPTGNQ